MHLERNKYIINKVLIDMYQNSANELSLDTEDDTKFSMETRGARRWKMSGDSDIDNKLSPRPWWSLDLDLRDVTDMSQAIVHEQELERW